MVLIEGLQVTTRTSGPSRAVLIEQASSRTLVLRNIAARRGYGYRNTGSGDVFIEDFHSIPLDNLTSPDPLTREIQPEFVFRNQRVWARQLNPELGVPEIRNDGATVWILGLKCEQKTTLTETINGGRTEVLGGLTITSESLSPPSAPAFVNVESSHSIVHSEWRQNASRGTFTTVVQETRNGSTQTLSNTAVPSRKAANDTSQSYMIPLYTGYQAGTDVSGQFTVTRGGFRYNRATGRYVQALTLQYTGTTGLNSPVWLALDGLSAGVTLANAAGNTRVTSPSGSPYVEAPGLAGREPVAVVLEFANPTNQSITYTTRTLTGNP